MGVNYELITLYLNGKAAKFCIMLKVTLEVKTEFEITLGNSNISDTIIAIIHLLLLNFKKKYFFNKIFNENNYKSIINDKDVISCSYICK